MTRRIRLLGPPQIERDGRTVDAPPGCKAWGLLAYLVLADRPPSRQHLAQLLFGRADDPMAALRWNLSRLRRALGGSDFAAGDPVVLGLGDADTVDVRDVLHGTPPDDLARLGAELLEGLSFDAEPAFAAWLDLARHTARVASGALLAEALADLDTGSDHLSAAALAQRALLLDDLNDDYHALLVRSLVRAGASEPARRHVARAADLYRSELGADLPTSIGAALTAAT